MRKTRMNRLVAAAIAFACGLAAWAMPTKEELMQAQELVKDLTADDVRAMKSGAKKPGEVAVAQVALAGEVATIGVAQVGEHAFPVKLAVEAVHLGGACVCLHI